MPRWKAQTLKERFDSKVLKSAGCWLWTGSTTRGGYGQIGASTTASGKPTMARAHRVSYFLEHGVLPEGLAILHSCDNRLCVNPAHLRAGTIKDNTDDMLARGRGDFGRNPKHKWLSLEIAQDIRTDYATGDYTMQELANKYETSAPQVCRVVNNKIWRTS